MHKHPAPQIVGAAAPRKNMLPQQQSERIRELSEAYLVKRNETLTLTNQAHTIELAIQRGSLVEKKLVERQSTFLLVAMRRKLMSLSSHAHKFTGTKINSARNILREIGLSVLAEIQDLPNCVEENWLAKVKEEKRKS